MQKIVPNIWCNGNAKEMAEFYTSVFPKGEITDTMYYPKTVEEGLADFQKDMAGKELTIDFSIAGFRFILLNADRTFTPNPSISFFFRFNTTEEMDALWAKLNEGGKVLMPLQKYPFNDYYGWIQDKFGLSWQLILNKETGDMRPEIMPSIMFINKNAGHAEEAMSFYLSVFKDSERGNVSYYPEGGAPDDVSKVAYEDFQLEGVWFAAMDAGKSGHKFDLNEGISLMVLCKDQEEIDHLWNDLSAVPESEQCGWLKDKYGVSWQITPVNVGELLKIPGAFKRMMKMKKLDIEGLKGDSKQ